MVYALLDIHIIASLHSQNLLCFTAKTDVYTKCMERDTVIVHCVLLLCCPSVLYASCPVVTVPCVSVML